MINFLSACEDYSFLSTILLVKRILEIICIIVPIALIILSAIEVSKIVFNPDAKVVKNVTTRIVHKVIAAVAVFFVPTIISVFLNMLGRVNYNATECWANANTQTIAAYKTAREAEEEVEKEKREAEKQKAEDERKVVEATREAAREENAEKAAEAAKNASANSSGTATELAAKLIQVAQEQYNLHPGDSPNKYTRGYGPIGGYGSNGYDYPWCAAFVWWCSNEAGVYPNKVSLKSASVDGYINHFKKTSGLTYQISAGYGGNYVPKMGDYIFFSNSHSQSDGSHIGLVKGVSGDKVSIIDGNCSNTICSRDKYLTDKYIIGYGVWE